MDGGCKRAVKVWHRKAGKDKVDLNFTIKKMIERVGEYAYLFPTLSSGRKILWDGIDGDGFRNLDHFPRELIVNKNDQEMKIRLKNGSLFQVVGTDRLEVVGPNPVGAVFSEYSIQNPRGWEYIRPVLTHNGGWAIFNYTPRGKNHGYVLYRMAMNNDEWFCQKLTVDDTGAVSAEAIDADRRSGMSEDMIQQEYYCSFELGVEGAYYSKYMTEVLSENRICAVPYDEVIPVFTFWDLGFDDSTAICFAQFAGREIRLIDYYENTGQGIAHYVKYIKEKPYIYGGHFAPHDIMATTLAGSTYEMAEEMGLRFDVVMRSGVQDGIEAVRSILRKCVFDKTKCWRLVDCLESYRRNYNDQTKAYSDTPRHDEFSHGADAFRYLANAYRQDLISGVNARIGTLRRHLSRPKKEYDILNYGL